MVDCFLCGSVSTKQKKNHSQEDNLETQIESIRNDQEYLQKCRVSVSHLLYLGISTRSPSRIHRKVGKIVIKERCFHGSSNRILYYVVYERLHICVRGHVLETDRSAVHQPFGHCSILLIWKRGKQAKSKRKWLQNETIDCGQSDKEPEKLDKKEA
jgi:hypothetical protein